MTRFFLQVAYKGTRFSGSQIQENALTVQFELEKALQVFFRTPIGLTGSSRTDAGVHALENFYHFDLDAEALGEGHPWLQPGGRERSLYNLNAILPPDVVARGVYPVAGDAHSRFHALSREYHYYVYRAKDPFLDDRGYYYPYQMDPDGLRAAAAIVLEHTDFSSFSKRGAQHRTPLCVIEESRWETVGATWCYTVRANRFLRGMVRGLVATMLQVGRGKLSVDGFREVILAADPRRADFTAPGHGLFLARVRYPEGLLDGGSSHIDP
ncbi:tRNA pseudouridine synthase A [Dinghuibacter silviterrae]|uniref:tRNA pseudouridine synthase A n=1 Tax=Dinghuibacter silviterrae TaxID=1539049 RepID=A0A4R8DMS8_9BACT|nr:tRNA pseudouridine synthase A [Dinghuibacter silviterrae]TDW98995.1 tRNA pseudouridine38-40 synthase [Dinghuibacter silviterrae]